MLMKRSDVSENRISGKIQSQRGASITFALLLFLVCAALSAVVLLAATTASGRMSNLAETDQRYYSVTSAAELLKTMLDEEAVSVIVAGDTTYTIPKHMNEITDSDLNISKFDDLDEYDEDETADTDESSDNQENTGAVTALKETIAKHCLDGEGYEATLSLSSQLKDAKGKDPLAVTVDEILDSEGNLSFIIYNTSGKPYKLMLSFSSDMNSDARPPVTKVEGKTVTNAREVSWHLTNMATAYDNTIIDNDN